MVKLILFAPCERVIVGQEDGAVSLISLLAGVTATLPFPRDQIPENAVVPLRWYVLSLWKHDPEDLGAQFNQRIAVESPSGREVLSAELTFTLPASPMPMPLVRGITQFNAFPVSELGTFAAKLFVKRPGEADWNKVADYPIQVIGGPVIDLSKPPVPENTAS